MSIICIEDSMEKLRIKELEKILITAQDEYYNGTPIMPDDEYDALADELADLDPRNKVLRRIGADVSDDSKLQKAKHTIPMGSQKKVNTQDEFIKWANKTGANRFVIQEKLDGLSVELVYKQGKLVQAITRGDGETGEDITHNVVHMGNVPLRLSKFTGSIRGEIILPISAFRILTHNSKDYANPRNAASGISRRKTINEHVLKNIKIIAFDCTAHGVDFIKEHHKIRFLEDLGVECVFTKVVDVSNAIKGYNLYQKSKRATLDHEIDGLVFKVNGIKRQEALGETDGRPKGQIAWKFAAEMRKTVLKSISWEVGLTGRITPVGHVEPVQVGGVTISKMSLHNVSNIQRLGVYPLADVLVSRRNDVIPCLEKVIPRVKSKQPGNFKIPTICPICKKATVFEGEYLMCANMDCPAKRIGDIKKWVKVLDIDQVGDAFIKDVVNAGFVEDPADLYTLSSDTIATLDGYQQKSARTIVRNIDKAKELPLKKFMGALNIPNVGTNTFEALANAGFDTIRSLQVATWGEFAKVAGVGDTTALAIYKGLINKQKLIEKLLKNGVGIKKQIQGKLTGKSFCFTGQISIKRGDAQKLVESMGGEIKTSVGKGLTYLVQASKTSQSGKSQKAKKYGIEILGETEFFDLIDFSFEKLQQLY